MVYLDFPKGDSTKKAVYIVKPVTHSLSEELATIIKKYLVDKAVKTSLEIKSPDEEKLSEAMAKELGSEAALAFEGGVDIDDKIIGVITRYYEEIADSFIRRMGNDEALAISCSLGGGEWINTQRCAKK
ncbi:hypothetical protein A8135_09380 [Legionella jamestowniensis]|uniref:Uncharacterized protein n=1 Tax=Legionella jamestowniensis TaxID=455 RepID=A0ABX2Y3X9_9GAMM|nr:hypothetical protein [Legionella jamestowniensis]OCH98960.1 hypothetical protein A8135_09380 [Legionella jamestowniensis]